jgi:hypothetical protein
VCIYISCYTTSNHCRHPPLSNVFFRLEALPVCVCLLGRLGLSPCSFVCGLIFFFVCGIMFVMYLYGIEEEAEGDFDLGTNNFKERTRSGCLRVSLRSWRSMLSI